MGNSSEIWDDEARHREMLRQWQADDSFKDTSFAEFLDSEVCLHEAMRNLAEVDLDKLKVRALELEIELEEFKERDEES